MGTDELPNLDTVMKITLCLAVLAVAVAMVQGEACQGMFTTGCSDTTCNSPTVLVCEHDECTCGAPCLTSADCSCGTPPPHLHGATLEGHCVDGGCACSPSQHDGGNHPPGPGGR